MNSFIDLLRLVAELRKENIEPLTVIACLERATVVPGEQLGLWSAHRYPGFDVQGPVLGNTPGEIAAAVIEASADKVPPLPRERPGRQVPDAGVQIWPRLQTVDGIVHWVDSTGAWFESDKHAYSRQHERPAVTAAGAFRARRADAKPAGADDKQTPADHKQTNTADAIETDEWISPRVLRIEQCRTVDDVQALGGVLRAEAGGLGALPRRLVMALAAREEELEELGAMAIAPASGYSPE